jgi:hypothetical protein
MYAKARRPRPVAAIQPDHGPVAYWGLALLVACTGSWFAIIGATKLVAGLIH